MVPRRRELAAVEAEREPEQGLERGWNQGLEAGLEGRASNQRIAAGETWQLA